MLVYLCEYIQLETQYQYVQTFPFVCLKQLERCDGKKMRLKRARIRFEHHFGIFPRKREKHSSRNNIVCCHTRQKKQQTERPRGWKKMIEWINEWLLIKCFPSGQRRWDLWRSFSFASHPQSIVVKYSAQPFHGDQEMGPFTTRR